MSDIELRIRSGPRARQPYDERLLYDEAADRIIGVPERLHYLAGIDGSTLRRFAQANGCTVTRPRLVEGHT